MITRDQIPDETVCISHDANTLGKGINQIIHLSAMGKLSGILGSLTSIKEKEIPG